MRRRFLLTAGVLALVWVPTTVTAQEPPMGATPPVVSGTVVAGGPARGGDGEAGAHLFGGGGFEVLKPQWSENPAFTTTTTVTKAPVGGPFTTSTTTGTIDFEGDYNLAPIFWLGYVGENGLGIRARFFGYDETFHVNQTVNFPAVVVNGTTTTTSTIAAAVPGAVFSPSIFLAANKPDVLHADDRLKIYTYDVEGIYEDRCGWLAMTYFAGLRYGQITQDYTAGISNVAATTPGPAPTPLGRDISTVATGHDFSGVGPTVGLEALATWGGTGLGAYGGLRASALFGRDKQETFTSTVPTAVAPFGATTESSHRRDLIETQVDFELGGQWAVQMGGVHPFVRAAFVDHIWPNGGNPERPGAELLQLPGAQVTFGLNF